jgi:hypothetical protein
MILYGHHHGKPFIVFHGELTHTLIQLGDG